MEESPIYKNFSNW